MTSERLRDLRKRRREAQQKRITELEAALRPFAEWYIDARGLHECGAVVPLGVRLTDFAARKDATVGHLRRAAAVLNRAERGATK